MISLLEKIRAWQTFFGTSRRMAANDPILLLFACVVCTLFLNVEGILDQPSHASEELQTVSSCHPLSVSLIGGGGVLLVSESNSTIFDTISEAGTTSHVCATFKGLRAGITLQVTIEAPTDTPVDFEGIIQYLISEDGVLVFNGSSPISATKGSQFGPQLFSPSFADLSGGGLGNDHLYELDIIVVSASSAISLTVIASMRADLALLYYVEAWSFSWQVGEIPQWGGQIFNAPFPAPSGSLNSSQTYLNLSFTLTPSSLGPLPDPMTISTCLTASGVDCNPTGACLGGIDPWEIDHPVSLALFSAQILMSPLGTGCSQPTGVYFILNPKLGDSYPGPYSYQAWYSVDGPFQVQNPGHSGKGGLSTGEIIGIATGVGVALIFFVALTIWFIRRRRQHSADYESLPG